jgi:uncharacterized protein (DUF302 family)
MAILPDNGMSHISSPHSVDDTVNRIQAFLQSKAVNIFALVDHSGEAAKVGLKMNPTKLLIFGNPKGGTPLMQAAQTAGIDLPLKALVWQDEAGATFVSYNDPTWIAKRHEVGQTADAAVKAMSGLLDALAKAATTGP